jgi:hypothetical protein
MEADIKINRDPEEVARAIKESNEPPAPISGDLQLGLTPDTPRPKPNHEEGWRSDPDSMKKLGKQMRELAKRFGSASH